MTGSENLQSLQRVPKCFVFILETVRFWSRFLILPLNAARNREASLKEEIFAFRRDSDGTVRSGVTVEDVCLQHCTFVNADHPVRFSLMKSGIDHRI